MGVSVDAYIHVYDPEKTIELLGETFEGYDKCHRIRFARIYNEDADLAWPGLSEGAVQGIPFMYGDGYLDTLEEEHPKNKRIQEWVARLRKFQQVTDSDIFLEYNW